MLLLLFEALQLQRRFGLLDECLPFGPVSDAALQDFYVHPCYVALYIILPCWHADVNQWRRLHPFCATCTSPSLFRILKKKGSSQRRCYGHQMTLNSFSKHDTTTYKTEWQTTFRSFLSCNTCPSDIWSKSHVYLSYINKKDWVRGQFCGYQMQCFQNILEDLHVCTVCQWRLKHF